MTREEIKKQAKEMREADRRNVNEDFLKAIDITRDELLSTLADILQVHEKQIDIFRLGFKKLGYEPIEIVLSYKNLYVFYVTKDEIRVNARNGRTSSFLEDKEYKRREEGLRKCCELLQYLIKNSKLEIKGDKNDR